MAAAPASQTMSPQEYLAFERAAEGKHEYWHGEVFAMAGASRRHNLLVGNLVRLLGNALLEGPCEVYPSDMRVSRDATTVFTYPYVTVVCGEPRFADDGHDALLNPLLIVEVLSESTEAYDRGKKFEHYRGIASVRHYLLVAQDQPLVELYTRQPDGTWSLSDHRQGDAVGLSALDCEVAVAEIYRKVLDTPP
ncbi:Uma2 family endonuclease [Paraliomyxa miuraensis]|uniref:Uma2 family endonuclease n=1 Tax=Paraliomyxa miuraensis TaxID=376150 RepID=UPI00225B0F27|nr:Uma2 family endonuclease [Paraliomyxa miuraensis]MCX4246258.1 Uma2 family endonuclease [Paraliomyxa miuraensis]